ncbi:MAG: hypothetical protein JWM27_1017 [Gemmatimonadetes bacterium]|nr:hypothetical protein [Gemmatimonadota bacterium]
MERVIGGGPRAARVATLVIVALGLVAVAWAGFARVNSREHRAGRIRLGADSADVVGVLGPPSARCPGGSVDHLRESFPSGIPATTVDDEIVALREETAARWIYTSRGRAGCAPGRGDTEVGWDRGGRVAWYVAAIGGTPLVIPDSAVSGAQAP